jgi:acyl dehydratase
MISGATSEGTQFAATAKTVSQDRICAFSGGFPKGPEWPRRNIHTDLAFARGCGLDGQAASGAMFEGYLAQLMIDLFGLEWLRNGKMSLVFVKTVTPGEILTPKAVLRTKTTLSSGVEVLLDVWCENSLGTRVVLGTATGYVK